MDKPVKPTFKEAFNFWLKLGWISFGGPAGQIAIMHEYLVAQKKWISEKKFLHALNYCMLLPGPEAQQLATYIGWLLHGTRGGLAAGVLFILPSVFILLTLSILYITFGNIPWVYALFSGLKPAIVAIIIIALLKIGKKSLQNMVHYIIAALSFIAIFFLNISFPIIILSAICIGFIILRFYPSLISEKKSEAKSIDDEKEYFLTSKTILPHTAFSLKRLLQQISMFIFLWITPLLLFYFLSTDYNFWQQLIVFFTQAALITFGGAYAVLPYVAQVSVEKFAWLTQMQMMDGLALGETTPGPLIMVLAFVGFMAGYSQLENSLVAGSVALLTTTYYTFLPCFLFIFAGAPLIEKTQANKTVKSVLQFVTAAVTGVVLNLAIYFAQHIIFPKRISLSEMDYLMSGWIMISFIAMYRFKVGMLPWLGISALFGLAIYFF